MLALSRETPGCLHSSLTVVSMLACNIRKAGLPVNSQCDCERVFSHL